MLERQGSGTRRTSESAQQLIDGRAGLLAKIVVGRVSVFLCHRTFAYE
jgi:hypothetical protein